MADDASGDFTEVAFKVNIHPGEDALTADELQGVLDAILDDLNDPQSEASTAAADLGVRVSDMRVSERPAFLLEALLLKLAVSFAGGAASAGGALFFNKVIKPRLTRDVRADTVRDIEELAPDQPEGGDKPEKK